MTNGINFHIKSEKHFTKTSLMNTVVLWVMTSRSFIDCTSERTCCFHPHITSNMKTEAVRLPLSDIPLAKLRDTWACSGVVVKALIYKPAGRGFDSRWCNWNFSLI